MLGIGDHSNVLWAQKSEQRPWLEAEVPRFPAISDGKMGLVNFGWDQNGLEQGFADEVKLSQEAASEAV